MREEEREFRAGLEEWLTRYEPLLPRLLWEEGMDHLSRTDGMGLTLCFDGPLREALMERLAAWVRQQAPERQQILWPTVERLKSLGCHCDVQTWNELPPMRRAPVHKQKPFTRQVERTPVPQDEPQQHLF